MSNEVIRIREQIERECEAMKLALYGLAVVADHDTINHKYEAIGAYQELLAHLVGEEQATEVVCSTYMDIIK